MNPPILNRAGQLPEDGWYQIEVSGEHLNPAAKVVQVIDEEARTEIRNRFKAAAGAPHFAGLRIDRDHFSLDPDKTTEALGWLIDLRNRAGELEGRVEWTSLGQPLVEGKVFKFFSTVYPKDQVQRIGTRTIANREYPAVRPLCLECLALTNDPNNRGGRPISNRDGTSAGAAAENENKTTMKSLLKQLGLAEDASEESAVTALQVIQNRASKVETLTAERDTLLAAQVEADLEKYKNRFKAADRPKWQKQLISNRAGTIELLESIEGKAAAPEADAARITNRAGARTPEQIEAAKAKNHESARGAKISNRAAELRKVTPSLSRSAAFAKAEAEIDSK